MGRLALLRADERSKAMKTRKSAVLRLGRAKRLTKGIIPGPELEDESVRYQDA